jgi:hypothetical protein
VPKDGADPLSRTHRDRITTVEAAVVPVEFRQRKDLARVLVR